MYVLHNSDVFMIKLMFVFHISITGMVFADVKNF